MVGVTVDKAAALQCELERPCADGRVGQGQVGRRSHELNILAFVVALRGDHAPKHALPQVTVVTGHSGRFRECAVNFRTTMYTELATPFM